MKSKILILCFTFCLIFSATARAEFKSGLSLNQDQIDLKVIEYISDDNLSFYISPSLSYDNISNSRIKVGSRYYFPKAKNFFSELNFSLQYNAKNAQITTNLGYAKEITSISAISLTAGYSFSQNKDLAGAQINLGLDFSWANIADKLTQWQQENKEEKLKEKYNWEDEIISLILKEKIQSDMSKKQIEYSWGQPNQKYSSQGYQVWEYQLNGLSHILYFKNGQLEFWKQHKKY